MNTTIAEVEGMMGDCWTDEAFHMPAADAFAGSAILRPMIPMTGPPPPYEATNAVGMPATPEAISKPALRSIPWSFSDDSVSM